MTHNDTESTGFLYPFIESEETDTTALLDDLAASARAKSSESARLQQESLREYDSGLTEQVVPWRSGSRAAAGCTRSATAAAPPMPPHWRRCSATPHEDDRWQHGHWPRTKR